MKALWEMEGINVSGSNQNFKIRTWIYQNVLESEISVIQNNVDAEAEKEHIKICR